MFDFEVNRGRRSLRRGEVLSFSWTTWKAWVTLDGSVSAVEVPVSRSVPGSVMLRGAKVAVVHFDENNPQAAVVVGSYGSALAEWEAAGYDYILYDQANVSGCADHYRANVSGGPPAGWLVYQAATTSNVNIAKPSAWYLVGQNGATPWIYQYNTTLDLENDVPANNFGRFLVGPLWLRDGRYSANLGYSFGMYRDNAGAIDLTVYVRVAVLWDAGAGYWSFIGESSAGSSTSMFVMSFPMVQPIWLSFGVRNQAAKNMRADIFFGERHMEGATSLLDIAPGVAPTWGNVHLRYQQTARGAGVQDYVFIGATDYRAVGY